MAPRKIVGRKRHIAVDTDGRLLAVNLTTGDISDRAGAQMILPAIRKRLSASLGSSICTPTAPTTGASSWKAAYLDFDIEVVRRIEGQPGFNVLPRRWVVERTLAGWHDGGVASSATTRPASTCQKP